jgi:hypothetical protein
MPPLSVGTIWTFQEREWLDAFWAYRWLFIYCRSGVRDNLLPHRRPTTWAELRIPGLTQLLTVNSRANVCFHEVTPFACRIGPLFAESLQRRRPGENDSAIFRSDASSGCSELGYRPLSEWAALSQVNGRGRNR